MESKSTKNSSVKDEKENSWENKTSGNEEPVWYANIQQPIKFTKLTRNISSIDDIVVGGGITGMTTAYLLSKAGKKVVLVEDDYIGSSETSRTTAHT